jgi:hypothetical protein
VGELFVFAELDELRRHVGPQGAAVQLGQAGGLWHRSQQPAADDGGTVVAGHGGATWRRTCDPARLDARWFGALADGQHDDAPAIQRAIDALPATGGKVLLPGGRMRCGRSLRIERSFITLEGVNCGELSRHFEPSHVVGAGSLLRFDDCDGIIITPPSRAAEPNASRLGGVTLRDFGIAGQSRRNGRRAIVAQPSEGWDVFGCTDALLLERLYVIDYQWCAELARVDASVVTNCWFSECGNGMLLREAIYTVVSNTVIADNDGIGMLVERGRSNDILSCTFVRNEHGLLARDTTRLKIIGGAFETDPWGGPRQDKTLVGLQRTTAASVTAAAFNAQGTSFAAAIAVDAASDVAVANCTLSGIAQLVGPAA